MPTINFEDGSIKVRPPINRNDIYTGSGNGSEGKVLGAKVIPLDRIMPDPNNPRRAFEGLEDLAASFAYTPDRPGEPFNPPIVVKDGNMYRIIDGERRYRAMVEAGKVRSCLCYVADTLEVANSVAMMLATDNKVQLDDMELSQGVQQMLILGVDFKAVEDLGGLKDGEAKRIKRALDTRKDIKAKPVQTDLDDLIAIAELDNPHRMGELMGMLESEEEVDTGWGSDFQSKLSAYRAEKRNLDRKAELTAALEEAGIPIQESPEPEDGYSGLGSIYMFTDPSEAIAGYIEEGFAADDMRAYVFLGKDTSELTRADLFATDDAMGRVRPEDAAKPAETPEDAARRIAKEELQSQFEEHRRLQGEWLLAKAADLGKTAIGKRVADAVEDCLGGHLDKDAKKRLKDDGLYKLDYQPWMLCAAMHECRISDSFYGRKLLLAGDGERFGDYDKQWGVDSLQGNVDVLEALSASGYELSDWEMEISDRMTAIIEEVQAEDDASGEGAEADAA